MIWIGLRTRAAGSQWQKTQSRTQAAAESSQECATEVRYVPDPQADLKPGSRCTTPSCCQETGPECDRTIGKPICTNAHLPPPRCWRGAARPAARAPAAQAAAVPGGHRRAPAPARPSRCPAARPGRPARGGCAMRAHTLPGSRGSPAGHLQQRTARWALVVTASDLDASCAEKVQLTSIKNCHNQDQKG